MMINKRSEAQRIRFAKERFERGKTEFFIWFKKATKDFRKFMNPITDWYFFYQPRDKGDKSWHVIEWTIVTIGLLKVFDLI